MPPISGISYNLATAYPNRITRKKEPKNRPKFLLYETVLHFLKHFKEPSLQFNKTVHIFTADNISSNLCT